MHEVFKLLVPLRAVPDGETVTKRTGDKKYVVRRELRLFGMVADSNQPQVVEPSPSVVFLCDAESSNAGNIHCLPDALEVLWYASRHRVQELLDPVGD